MDAFKDAMKRKIEMLKAQQSSPLEGAIAEQGAEGEEELQRSPDMAPSLEGDAEVELAMDGESEMDPEMMQILMALSDKGPVGRSSQGLGERVGMDAKAKMLAMKGKK
jgi:hypothetical protein